MRQLTDLCNRFKRTHTVWLVLTTVLMCSFMCPLHAGEALFAPKVSLEFSDTNIRDVLQAIARAADINLVADSTVDGHVSLKLKNMTLDQALQTVVQANGAYYKLEDGVYKVSKNPFPVPPTIKMDEQRRVSVEAHDSDLRDVLLSVSKQANISIVPATTIAKKITLQLQSVPADQIVEVLSKAGEVECKQTGSVWFVNPIPSPAVTDSGQPGSAQPAAVGALSATGATRLVTQVVRLRHLKSSEALEYISKSCLQEATSMNGTAPEIRKTKDENVLLITATQSAIERLLAEIETIDFPAPQVMLEARILDVDGQKDTKLGLLLAKGGGGNMSVDILQGQVGYVMQGVSKELNSTIQALVQEGTMKVVASPSICTLTGKEASIDIGQVRYFKLTNYPDSSQPGSQGPVYYPYSSTLQTIEAGISLKITPWVGANGEITADILPEISSVTGVTPDGLPELNRRRASTTIRVRDGDTIVIGGLKQQEVSKTVSKVPVLGDLPLVGGLFRNTKKTNRDSELLILITPRILGSDGTPDGQVPKNNSDEASAVEPDETTRTTDTVPK